MQRFKAVLIDMDGTLVNSIPYLKNLFFKYISPLDSDFDFYNGKSMKEILEKIEDKRERKKIETLYERDLEEYYKNRVKSFEGVNECLKYLLSKNVKLALITSASPMCAKLCLRKIGLFRFFDYVFASNDYILKPEKEFYVNALTQLNMEPNEVIAVEDSLNGVMGSTNFGIYTYQIFSDSAQNVQSVSNWNLLLDYFKGIYE